MKKRKVPELEEEVVYYDKSNDKKIYENLTKIEEAIKEAKPLLTEMNSKLEEINTREEAVKIFGPVDDALYLVEKYCKIFIKEPLSVTLKIQQIVEEIL